MKSVLTNLQLTSANRNDVYDKGMIDEKLRSQADDIKELKSALDLYKVLGIVIVLITIALAFIQHVSLH